MDLALLNSEIQEYISVSIEKDVSKLALQKNPFPQFNWIEILNQIVAKQKAKEKLPTWFTAKNIIYPAKISIEQTSSEKTAAYKANLVFGENLIDATGGFGVDDYYFSKTIKHVTHCEINTKLSEIVRHNCKQLQVENITCIAGDSSEIIKNLNKKFEWIYIDPSRRNEAKGKVFMLKDCLPNVPELLDFYFTYTSNIILKSAPIFDITAGLLELKNVKEIHIVAVENEVKELLWILEKNYDQSVEIKTCNLLKNKQEKFNFNVSDVQSEAVFGLPKKYLYEPNSAIMKSGAFDLISSKFLIIKLHQNSHLYTSDILMDFPGRIFEIENNVAYQKKEMKLFLENKKANITTRNFPESAEIIRKKWKIKDGGNLYCFFTTNENDAKIVLLCSKLK